MLGDEARPVRRPRKAEAGLEGAVVVAKGGPSERDHVAGGSGAGRRRRCIAEDRAVAGLPDAQRHVVAVLHLDDLAAYPEPPVAVGRQVAGGVLRVELLDEEVLGVRAGVGKAPRGPAVVPEHHDRHSGKGRAHDVAPRPGEVGEVPDGGNGEAEVGVVREERLLRHAPRSAHDPAIGAGMAAPGAEEESRRAGCEGSVEPGRLVGLDGRVPVRGRRRVEPAGGGPSVGVGASRGIEGEA